MRNERSTLSGSVGSPISARRSAPASSLLCATGKIFSIAFQSSTHRPTTRFELTSTGLDLPLATKTPAGNLNGNLRTSAKDAPRTEQCDCFRRQGVIARQLVAQQYAGRSRVPPRRSGSEVCARRVAVERPVDPNRQDELLELSQ